MAFLKFPSAHIVTGLVAAFACGTGVSRAEETLLNEIPGVIAAATRVELIRDNFQGTEGPIALPDGNLIFTEPLASRIVRVSPQNDVSTFLSDTNGANALAFSPAGGELVAVHIAKPALAVIFPAGQAKILAQAFQGVGFYRPNDLVIDRSGGVYFTDPSGPPKPEQSQPPPPSVYYYTAAGKLLRLTTAIPRPNGIQLSPDEKTLYVANTSGEFVLAFDVLHPGEIGPAREFAKLAGYRKLETGMSSGADGLAIDAAGRLYVATLIGVQVFTAQGTPLGVITLPKQPQNLAFAGPDKKSLYVVGRGAVYRIAVLTPGFAGRAK